MLRTHTCGELRAEHIQNPVTLCGWVQNHRDHGGVIFVDLRDRGGLTQVVFDPDLCGKIVHEQANRLRSEWVIQISGTVRSRGTAANANLATGAIEVVVNALTILNQAQTPPFELDEHAKVGEEVRLKYRFLDLRRPVMQRNLMLRHRALKVVRDYFDTHGFMEIETPVMGKYTPGGARNFLVPSRLTPGGFYALAESPQLFKQLLMIAGYDRYLQIAHCFRDEDLRGDRQPEFTQIDLEMSFLEMDDLMNLAEGMVRLMWKTVLGVDLPSSFLRMTWTEAMRRFGSDKPDLRFGLEIIDLTDWAPSSGFSVFQGAVATGGVCRAINAKGAAEALSRRTLDQLGDFVKGLGAKGLAWIKIVGGEWQGPAAKNISEAARSELGRRLQATDGDVLFFAADREPKVCKVLGALRVELGVNRLQLARWDDWRFLWVHSAPLFEWSEEDQKLVACHHAFTSPQDADVPKLATDPAAVLSKSYDIVLNGVEVGGGSIRIHDPTVQSAVFKVLGISPEEQQRKFGFLLHALSYGAPPHGGMAFGFDRLMMLIVGGSSIREVIAFPKNQRACDLMLDAPGPVSEQQLKDLYIVSSAPAPG